MRNTYNLIIYGGLLFIFLIGIIILLIGSLSPEKYLEKVRTEEVKEVEEIQYADGVVLEKIFDLYTKRQAFVYRNNLKKVFVVDNPEFWSQVTIGDSIRMGFRESGEGLWNYRLEFISMELLGKAKSYELDFEIINSQRRNNTTINHFGRWR